tara:strand:- start:873 stop:1043 length:171 start_codon:yes stop_codon:yes gene_type:complete
MRYLEQIQIATVQAMALAGAEYGSIRAFKPRYFTFTATKEAGYALTQPASLIGFNV